MTRANDLGISLTGNSSLALHSEIPAAISTHSAAADPHTAYIKKLAYNAKGDILVGTSQGNYLNLTVGADGTLLIADSTQTGGIRWAVYPVLGSTTLTPGTTISTIAGLTLTSPTVNTPTINTPTFTGTLSLPTNITLSSPYLNYGVNSSSSTSLNSSATDPGNFVVMTYASPNTYTITGTYSTGASITVIQKGTGQTTITGTGVVSSGAISGSPKLRTQYSSATALYDGTNWIVIGDIV